MAVLNRRLGTPEETVTVWNGAVGATTSLISTTDGRAARMIVVGVAGTLDLVDINNAAISYTAAEVVAHNFTIRGNWTSVVNTSTAHTLKVYW